jgi:peptidoglycan/LPS O-acetylase OafA/YrhL
MNQNNRYEELDSLRGLAALAVILVHLYDIFPGNKMSYLLFEYGPFRLFISGEQSVILFFVLSGFVLSLPYLKNHQSNYKTFIIKRICRIYLPYLFAIFLAIIFKVIFYDGKITYLSGWFNSFWSQPITLKVIVQHLFLIGTFLSNLDPVIWSLVHEMRISIVFPLIMFFIVKFSWKKNILICLCLSIISLIYYVILKPSYLGTEGYVTLYIVSMFIVGALIAKYRFKLIEFMNSLSRMHKIIMFLGALLIYVYIHPSYILNAFIFKNMAHFYRSIMDNWVTTLASIILIVFALSSTQFTKFLRNNIFRYLGKISYSLYLTHFIIMFTCYHVLSSILPKWEIALISLVLAFAFSTLMYFFIEEPSIKLGRIITSKRLINQTIFKQKQVS